MTAKNELYRNLIAEHKNLLYYPGIKPGAAARLLEPQEPRRTATAESAENCGL
jgi:hypothetical protein